MQNEYHVCHRGPPWPTMALSPEFMMTLKSPPGDLNDNVLGRTLDRIYEANAILPIARKVEPK